MCCKNPEGLKREIRTEPDLKAEENAREAQSVKEGIEQNRNDRYIER